MGKHSSRNLTDKIEYTPKVKGIRGFINSIPAPVQWVTAIALGATFVIGVASFAVAATALTLAWIETVKMNHLSIPEIPSNVLMLCENQNCTDMSIPVKNITSNCFMCVDFVNGTVVETIQSSGGVISLVAQPNAPDFQLSGLTCSGGTDCSKPNMTAPVFIHSEQTRLINRGFGQPTFSNATALNYRMYSQAVTGAATQTLVNETIVTNVLPTTITASGFGIPQIMDLGNQQFVSRSVAANGTLTATLVGQTTVFTGAPLQTLGSTDGCFTWVANSMDLTMYGFCPLPGFNISLVGDTIYMGGGNGTDLFLQNAPNNATSANLTFSMIQNNKIKKLEQGDGILLDDTTTSGVINIEGDTTEFFLIGDVFFASNVNSVFVGQGVAVFKHPAVFPFNREYYSDFLIEFTGTGTVSVVFQMPFSPPPFPNFFAHKGYFSCISNNYDSVSPFIIPGSAWMRQDDGFYVIGLQVPGDAPLVPYVCSGMAGSMS
jgi:hypothetical protein